jgi:hypothetical protein
MKQAPFPPRSPDIGIQLKAFPDFSYEYREHLQVPSGAKLTHAEVTLRCYSEWRYTVIAQTQHAADNGSIECWLIVICVRKIALFGVSDAYELDQVSKLKRTL